MEVKAEPLDLPTEAIDAIRDAGRAPRRPASITGAATALVDAILEGGRHTTLVSLTGQILGRGLEYGDVRLIIESVNMARCQPPLEDREVDEIIEDMIAKHEKERTTTDPSAWEGGDDGPERNPWTLAAIRGEQAEERRRDTYAARALRALDAGGWR